MAPTMKWMPNTLPEPDSFLIVYNSHPHALLDNDFFKKVRFGTNQA